MYGLTTTQWITQVNGRPVNDLDEFIGAVQHLSDNEYVRLKVLTFDMVPCVISIKMNRHYWPTIEVTLDLLTKDGTIQRTSQRLDT
jgi:hypothetical protein